MSSSIISGCLTPSLHYSISLTNSCPSDELAIAGSARAQTHQQQAPLGAAAASGDVCTWLCRQYSEAIIFVIKYKAFRLTVRFHLITRQAFINPLSMQCFWLKSVSLFLSPPPFSLLDIKDNGRDRAKLLFCRQEANCLKTTHHSRPWETEDSGRSINIQKCLLLRPQL